jgi:hypothetical protein
LRRNPVFQVHKPPNSPINLNGIAKKDTFAHLSENLASQLIQTDFLFLEFASILFYADITPNLSPSTAPYSPKNNNYYGKSPKNVHSKLPDSDENH